MSWLHYLIEANIYLGIFYLCYCLFLNTETHYTLSRAYLLFSCVVAFVLPVTQLSILKPTELFIDGQATAYINTGNITQQFAPPPPPVAPHFTWQDALIYAYALGAAVAMGIFIFRLYQLFKLSRSKKKLVDGSYQLIQLNDENTAFSFFNYLFIGSNLSQAETIIAHELVHIRQKHSWDIMLLEMLKVISWFNPFIYLTQRSLKTVHEYIADEQTAANERDALTYSSFLLNNAYGVQGSAIAHSFFNYNLLKKRIIMLNKNRSGKLARLKYLAVLPLCGGMLCASTLAFSKDYGWVELSPKATLAVKEPAKPEMIKYLKISDKSNNRDITAYSGNISITVDGVKKTYLATTITGADIAYLWETRKLKVEVIDVDSKSKMAVTRVNIPDAPADTTKKHRLPPPPPAPPTAKIARRMPPPPPPHLTEYTELVMYMTKHTRYPAAAVKNGVMGNILLNLSLDGAHKITDVKVEQGIGSGCDEEAVRALKAFPGSVAKAAGTYKMMITFGLIGKDGPKANYPKQISADIAGQPNFIAQVNIQGFPDGLKLPPPPPAPPKKYNGKLNKIIPAAPPVEKQTTDGGAPQPIKVSNKTRALISSTNFTTSKKPLLKISGINSPTIVTIDGNKSLRVKARPNKGGNIVEIMDKKALPLVFINGTRQVLQNNINNGEHLYMTATDSMIMHNKGEVYASNKWGGAAKNGVVELFGQTSIYVK